MLAGIHFPPKAGSSQPDAAYLPALCEEAYRVASDKLWVTTQQD